MAIILAILPKLPFEISKIVKITKIFKVMKYFSKVIFIPSRCQTFPKFKRPAKRVRKNQKIANILCQSENTFISYKIEIRDYFDFFKERRFFMGWQSFFKFISFFSWFLLKKAFIFWYNFRVIDLVITRVPKIDKMVPTN